MAQMDKDTHNMPACVGQSPYFINIFCSLQIMKQKWDFTFAFAGSMNQAHFCVMRCIEVHVSSDILASHALSFSIIYLEKKKKNLYIYFNTVSSISG